MRSRPGFILVAAIVAVAMIAILVTSVVFASGQEAHAAGARVLDQKVLSFAERGVTEAMADWVCPECYDLAVGQVIIRNPAASPPLESTVFITRLDSAVFLVSSEARFVESGTPRLRRRVSIALRMSRDSLGNITAERIAGDAWTIAWQM